ncbi:MAG: hypothetical protein JXR07_20305 [Reichenbachiella sp.]
MIERINNICKIEYTKISEVISISENYQNPAAIETTWTELPMASGSLISISEKSSKGNTRFTTNFSGFLTEKFNLDAHAIIKVTLDDDTILVIGDIDTPVQLRSTHSLFSKALRFTHQNFHYPHEFTES